MSPEAFGVLFDFFQKNIDQKLEIANRWPHQYPPTYTIRESSTGIIVGILISNSLRVSLKEWVEHLSLIAQKFHQETKLGPIYIFSQQEEVCQN